MQFSHDAVVGKQQGGRARQEPFAQCRQRDGLIVALEQAAAGDRFEPLNVDADGGGTFVHVLGRHAELAQSRHGMKSPEEFDIQDGRHDS
jgi:hypothetical protein